ncbi:MAG: hypothetical protein ACU0CA_16645 [Paracoccaceae bacterium]
MKKLSPNMLLIILLSVIALPEAAALMLYKYTGDPTLRPFGISKFSLSESDRAHALTEILVRVDWGAGVPSSIQRDDVGKQLGKALEIYDIAFRLNFQRVSGDDINVTYTVGHNEIGPYRFQNASRGIPAALSAYRSMKKFNQNK